MKKNTSARRGFPLYIVDGYNVILSRKAFTDKRSLEEARTYLVRLIDSYASRKMIDVIVVWDGEGNHLSDRSGGSRIKVIYTRTNQSADSKIVSMLESKTVRKRAIVVSDDRRHITTIAGNLGVKSIKVSEFLNLLGIRLSSTKVPKRGVYKRGNVTSEDHKDEKSRADDLSVKEWLELFKSKKK